MSIEGSILMKKRKENETVKTHFLNHKECLDGLELIDHKYN